MKFITDLIKYFTYITTGIVFVFIVILLLGNYSGISTKTLVQIPCASLATALVTMLLFPKEAKTSKEFNIMIGIHYIVLCIVMIVVGVMFEWVNFDLAGIMTMVISTAAVYIFTFAVSYLSSKREADDLNSALKNKSKK